jgi:hypothetical protein
METGSRTKQVLDSVSTLEKSLAELKATAESLIGALEKVLSPQLAKIKDSISVPKQQKVILANSLDAIIDSARNVTEMLADAQSRLEV